MKKLKRWYIFNLAVFAISCWILYNADELSPYDPTEYSIPALVTLLLSLIGAGVTWHEMKRRKN